MKISLEKRSKKWITKKKIFETIQEIEPARFREIREEANFSESTLSEYLEELRNEGKIFPVAGKRIVGKNVNFYAAVKSPPEILEKEIENLRRAHQEMLDEVKKAKEAGDRERFEDLFNSYLSSFDLCMLFSFTESLIHALKHYGNEPEKACRVVVETWGLVFTELIISAVRIGHEDPEASIDTLKEIKKEKIESFRDWMSKNSN